MKRVLSRIGKPSPVEVERARLSRRVYLPCYVKAQRREREITVVVQSIKINTEGFGSVKILGNDRGKKWSWHAEYNREGSKVADISEYAGPYSVFSAFVGACLRGDVLNIRDHRETSAKAFYDNEFKKRIADGQMTEGDHRWLEEIGSLRDL